MLHKLLACYTLRNEVGFKFAKLRLLVVKAVGLKKARLAHFVIIVRRNYVFGNLTGRRIWGYRGKANLIFRECALR